MTELCGKGMEKKGSSHSADREGPKTLENLEKGQILLYLWEITEEEIDTQSSDHVAIGPGMLAQLECRSMGNFHLDILGSLPVFFPRKVVSRLRGFTEHWGSRRCCLRFLLWRCSIAQPTHPVGGLPAAPVLWGHRSFGEVGSPS